MFRYIWAWIQALFGYVKVWLQAATEEDPHDSAWLGAAPAMEEDPVTVSLGPIGPLFQQLRSAIASLQGNSGRLKLKGVKAQIQILGQELEWLCIDVKGLPEAPEDAMTRCWMRQVRDLCYDTADYLDELMHFIHNSSRTRRRTFEGNRLLGSKTFLISQKLTWLSLPKVKKLKRAPLIAKLSALVARVEDADETRQRFKISPPKYIKHDYAQAAGVSHIMPQIPLQLHHIDKLTKLLALDDNEMEKNLKVVTIFGSAGVGKTALARTLYHQHRWRFQHRAFVRVSRDPDMRWLLTDMLSQIKAPQTNPFSDVQGLIGSVTQHLQGKRYLIIIDDLWTTSTWDIIIRALPDGDYCRIITTTQVEDVALACCSYQMKHIYEITPLNDDQSGKSEGGCTTYTSSEGMKEALNLVYNNLPPRLKSCLLYLNMYPEGCMIRKDELVKQWAAEGLIASVQGEDIEGTAGYYFDALVSSGLVQSVDTNHNGEVLSCTLHHMVLDLIRQKSMEENFITIVNYFQTILGLPDKVRRLSVQLGGAKGANNIPENMRISQVRSLLFSGFFQHVPSILDYGLLQVLILQIWSDQDRTFDLTKIGELYRLRYLKIESNMTVKLPGKIRRLRHLGTLQVDATLCVVPSDIVHLEKLLHLCLPSESILPHGVGRMTSLRTLGYFDLGSNLEDNVRSLSELENLHNLQLTCSTVQPAESLEKNMQLLGSVLLKLSSLRTVTLAPASGSCKGNSPPDYAAVSSMSISCDRFSSISPAPAHLRILELSRRCCVFSRLPHWLGELAHLLILKIAVRELSKEDTDILKGLPSLTALSLHVATRSAEMIVFGKGGFSVLTYFKFTCTVPWLKLEAGAMPNIQNLSLVFNSMIVDKQGITIEYLSGIKEISARSKGSSLYSVGARSAWLKGITNDPRNPKVKWIRSEPVGDECTGHVVTQEAQEYYRIQDKGSGGSEIMDETDGVHDEGSGSQPKKYPSEYVLRKYLMFLATLMVTVTYSVWFDPPGGLWQDSMGGYLVGRPIIQTANNLRYPLFFYCNAIALASSILVVVLLLVSNDLVEEKEQCVRIRLLRVLMMLDLLSLLGAYAVVTCRDMRTAVCTVVLTAAGVSVYAVVLKWGDPVSGPADQDEIAVELQEKERLRKVLMLVATFVLSIELQEKERLRKVLMLVATFVLSITYVSGLNFPGGFWDSTWGGHHPGDSILKDGSHKSRLATFFVCNTIAFMSSLVIIMLLLGKKFHARTTARTWSSEMLTCVLAVAMLIGLVGAYTAGSSREGGATAYVAAVVAAGLVCLLLRTRTSSSSLQRDRDEDEQSQSFLFHMYGLYNGVPSADNWKVWDKKDMRQFQSARSLPLLLSTFATVITYLAGLYPPGGVWQDNKDDHLAGDPILLSTNIIRYKTFFFCNSVAFMASLMAVILFMLNTVSMFRMLEAVIMLELFGLAGAYAAGACRNINTSIYGMALGGTVLLYVVIYVILFMPGHREGQRQELVELEKKRKMLYLLATLSTAVSYQAGLKPPAGFWIQAYDDDNKHEAGYPVLLYNNPGRYHAFLYCNSLSFILSVTTMILLMSRHLYIPAMQSGALNLCAWAGLCCLMGAYAAVITLTTTSIGILLLMVVVLLIVVVLYVIFFLVAERIKMSEEDEVGLEISSEEANMKYRHTSRKTLMLLGILVAAVTYQAGLAPPGGVWQSSDGTGSVAMRDNRKQWYPAFFYSNSTAFAGSLLLLLLLLMQQQLKRLEGLQIKVFRSVVMLDLLALLVAYTVGTSRDLSFGLFTATVGIAGPACLVIMVVTSVTSFSHHDHTVTGHRQSPFPVL